MGLIDEFSIYSRALSSKRDRGRIYAAGSAGKCKPPTVIATLPRNGEARVQTNTVISATFSHAYTLPASLPTPSF